MSLAALWAFLAVALPVLGSLIAGLSTVDLAYHLRAGELLLDTGRIPMTDTFTFTAAGQPWLNQQWGAQALLAAVYRAGGWTLLVVLRAVLVGVLYGTVFVASRRQGLSNRFASILTIAAFALSAAALALRPQLFGMVLFAVTLLIVVERRRRPALLWLVPPIVLVWANLHGSFFLGPAVVGLAWLHDLHDRAPGARRTLLVTLVAAVAACATPYGPSVWAYAAGLSTNLSVTERIEEWQRTSIRTPVGLAFYASALALAAFLARRGRATPWPALLWFAAFFFVGAWAARGAAWWPLAAAVGLAGLLGTGFLGSGGPVEDAGAAAGRPTPRRARRLNAALAAIIAAVAVVLLPWWRPIDPGLGAPRGVLVHAPSGITGALRDLVEPGDRIFHPQPWGSWFELALPEALTVVDSRIELFPNGVWTEYGRVSAGQPGWQARLDDWQVTVVVAGAAEAALASQLRSEPAWRSIHADADGKVFVRSDRSDG